MLLWACLYVITLKYSTVLALYSCNIFRLISLIKDQNVFHAFFILVSLRDEELFVAVHGDTQIEHDTGEVPWFRSSCSEP